MSFNDFQEQVSAGRKEAESTRAKYQAARRELNGLQRRDQGLRRVIASDERETSTVLENVAAEQSRLKQIVENSKVAYGASLVDEVNSLREFLDFTNPVDHLTQLPDDCPILMFPLRLETRFKKVDRNGASVDQLWVRVFPDEIAIDSFESDLSASEYRNTRRYWINRWASGKQQDGHRAAWRNLASSHGPGRAYWLTQNLQPENLDEEPEISDNQLFLIIAAAQKPSGTESATLDTYWTAVWKANDEMTALAAAWNLLLDSVVNQADAEALIEKYAVHNIRDAPPPGRPREDVDVAVEYLVLPEIAAADDKLHAWSEPPATTILPERFVLLAYTGNDLAFEPQLSNPVSPNLIVGPDPSAEEGEDFRLATKADANTGPSIDEGDLLFSDGMRWMFDFDTAIANGMGFRIDLDSDQAEHGFDKLIVLGVKLSANKSDGQEKLEDLFHHHHSSRKGMSLLKQGTPTNNTDDAGAGYSWKHDTDDSFGIHFEGAADSEESTDWYNKSDGRWLADMLGIDADAISAVENYDSSDISESLAMQRALWPATMGHFLQSMMSPVFSENTIEQTHEFFTKYVTARGCIPAIRVGRQPYGILPATNFSGMRWFLPREHDDHVLGADFLDSSQRTHLTHVYSILSDMDRIWNEQSANVSHVGKSGDAHQILLDIVGLHPSSVELFKRYANTIKQIWNVYLYAGDRYDDLIRFWPNSHLEQAQLMARLGYPIDSKHPAPNIFDKVFFENVWRLFGPRIDKVPNTETDAISNYTADGRNYIQWLIDAGRTSHDTLRKQQGFADDKKPNTLLYLLMHYALDVSYVDTSLKLYIKHSLIDQQEARRAYREPDFIQIKSGNQTESRWRHLYSAEPAITGDASQLLERYIPENIDDIVEAAAFRDSLEGMQHLIATPTSALDRLLLEHLDTVSYRYDAWVSGFLHKQLELMRGMHVSDDGTPTNKGVYIGAYGWLENLRPENKNLRPVRLDGELTNIFNTDGDLLEDPTNAGFVIAPSVNHAITSSVLLNGHLTSEDPMDSEQLKIKLTSERVRLALQIIEGIQGGQTLAALLGYRFERGLHDRTDSEVDEFILDLRNAFPLVSKKNKETTPADDDPDYDSIEQIEANNVIDGVAFLEHVQKNGNSRYPFDLDLPAADPQQRNAIDDEVRSLLELNDAIADLAMAESVHQVVLGNYERASAVLDTYSKGNFPPTPDVIKTPRSGTAITHRVGLQFKTGITHNIDGVGVTPRMVAEPAMNEWLTDRLPPLNRIVCIVRYLDRGTSAMQVTQVSLSDLGLSAIDALYIVDVDDEQAMSSLDDLVVHHVLRSGAFDVHFRHNIEVEYVNKIDSADYSVFEVGSLLTSLRELLLKSRNLLPTDVKLPSEAATHHAVDLALGEDRLQPVITKIRALRDNELQNYIDQVDALIAADNVNDIIDELNTLIAQIRELLVAASRFGIGQTGIGFVYQWHQSMLAKLIDKIIELDDRLQKKRTAYLEQRSAYIAAIGSVSDEELFTMLQKLELKIATSSSFPLPATPGQYFADIENTKFSAFEILLDNDIAGLLSEHRITELINGILDATPQIASFDFIGVNVENELKQVLIFVEDLQIAAGNLSNEINDRSTRSESLLDAVGGSVDAIRNVELVREAGKALFGDRFVMVPEFSMDDRHATEWANSLMDSAGLLRHLEGTLDRDFPVDDWLYGVSRVRETMYHFENTVLQADGFQRNFPPLVPSQFPYRERDYWLAMEFPENVDGGEDQFAINEDKLLYTASYSEAFDPTKRQCGLLVDEWTEVIPSRDETAGMSFHYDQPNSEPPQALLLVTPSQFTGHWQWQDLVDAVSSTLAMAKKRAVEPDHIDTTEYSLFLPTIVSLTSPLALTSVLTLALNNDAEIAKLND